MYSFIPQMSPFNWTLLLLIFLTTMISISSKLFFSPSQNKLLNKSNSYNGQNNYIWSW